MGIKKTISLGSIIAVIMSITLCYNYYKHLQEESDLINQINQSLSATAQHKKEELQSKFDALVNSLIADTKIPEVIKITKEGVTMHEITDDGYQPFRHIINDHSQINMHIYRIQKKGDACIVLQRDMTKNGKAIAADEGRVGLDFCKLEKKPGVVIIRNNPNLKGTVQFIDSLDKISSLSITVPIKEKGILIGSARILFFWKSIHDLIHNVPIKNIDMWIEDEHGTTRTHSKKKANKEGYMAKSKFTILDKELTIVTYAPKGAVITGINSHFLERVIIFIVTIIIIIIVVTIIYHYEGKAIRFVEKNKALLQAQKNERKLTEILNQSSSVIFMKDSKYRYLFINRAYEKLFNLKNSKIKGKNDYDFFSKEVADTLRENDAKTILEKTPHQVEEEVNGRLYLVNKFLVQGVDGTDCLCGIATDITERRERESLKVALEMAASVCHNFNQPLEAIGIIARILTKTNGKDEELVSELNEITNQVRIMGNLTKKLEKIERYKTEPYVKDEQMFQL